jgi:hypothetical protein
VTIVADGRVVTPEEVARTMVLWGMSVHNAGPKAGPDINKMQGMPETAQWGAIIPLWDPLAGRLNHNAGLVWPPITITADARTIAPPRLPDGVICYADPPYSDTTGYKHDLPRAEVVKMARTWADAGATVCISEAEPIPDLIAEGWHAVEISATRKGAKRTFSKQQAEWLTLSRPPSFVPRETMSLFG